MKEVVTCLITIIDANNAGGVWMVHGRVVDVDNKVPAETALCGVRVRVMYRGPMKKHLVFKAGIVLQIGIPLPIAEKVLDIIGDGTEPMDIVIEAFEVLAIHLVSEPCARVPISILREMRGFSPKTEMSRRAILQVWSEDRKTGTKAE